MNEHYRQLAVEEADYLRRRAWDFIDRLEKLDRELGNVDDGDPRRVLWTRIGNTRYLRDDYTRRYEAMCEEAGIPRQNLAPNLPGRGAAADPGTPPSEDPAGGRESGASPFPLAPFSLAPFFLAPARNPRFTGRREEVRACIRRLLAGENCAIRGAREVGGIGKTGIAVEVCHLFRETWRARPGPPEYVADLLTPAAPEGGFFRDGILWIRFESEGWTPKSLAEYLIPNLMAPGAAGESPPDPGALAETLAGREVLVVLDGVERNLRAFDDLLHWFAGRCPLIITSRVALPGIHAEVIDALPDAEAEALFAGHLADRRLSDEERARAAGLCRLLGNLPLAIGIAAARLALHDGDHDGGNGSLAGFETAFREERQRRVAGSGGDEAMEPRDADVLSALALSFHRLDGPERRALLHASLFNYPFTVSALAALVDDGDERERDEREGDEREGDERERGEREMERIVQRLLRLSLVERFRDGDEGQEPGHALQPLVREFALGRLRQGIEIVPGKADGIARLPASPRGPERPGQRPPGATDTAPDDRERAPDSTGEEHLEEHLGACRAYGDRGEKVENCGHFPAKFEDNSELFDENLRETWANLPLSEPIHPKSDRLLGDAPSARWRERLKDPDFIGQVTDAMAYRDRILDFVRVEELMTALDGPLADSGCLAEKIPLNRLAVRAAVALQRPARELHWRLVLADALERQAVSRAELEGARLEWTRALRIARALRRTDDVLSAQYHLATILRHRWDPAGALRAGYRGIREACRHGDEHWLGAFTGAVGKIHNAFVAGPMEVFARIAFGLSARDAGRDGRRKGSLLRAYADNVDVLYGRGRIKHALAHYRRLLQWALESGDTQLIAASVRRLFDCHLYWRDERACEEYLDDYTQLATAMGLPESNRAEMAARLACLRGACVAAEQLFLMAARKADLHGDHYDYWLGRTYLHREDLDKAAEYLDKALAHHREHRNAVGMAEVHTQLALLALKRKDARQAVSNLATALETQRRHDIEPSPEEAGIGHAIQKQLARTGVAAEEYEGWAAEARPIDLEPDFLSPELPGDHTGRDGKAMALIPAGPAFVGQGAIESLAMEELPERVARCLDPGAPPPSMPAAEIYLYPYYMDREPVSHAEYRAFCAATGHPRPAHWPDGEPPESARGLPVVNVGLEDASAYAEWAGKAIPTAWEWEKACRGEKGALYPWGDEWDGQRVKARERASDETEHEGPVPPASFAEALECLGGPGGNRSPQGIRDLVGAIHQLTISEGDGGFLIKGGAWSSRNPPEDCRGWAAETIGARDTRMDVGFRCVRPVFGREEGEDTGQ